MLTNEDIMLAWNQECKIERDTTGLIIAFARLIAEKQKEIDAEIVIDHGTTWNEWNPKELVVLTDWAKCAAAIRKGGAA